MRLVTLPIAAVLCIGCAHVSQTTWKLDRPDAMRQMLIERIPEGTAIDAAKQFMEQEGFACKVVRDGTFVERPDFHGEITHEHLDFLECTRSQGAKEFLVTRTWTVAVVLEGGKVRTVLVSHSLDGP